MPDHVAADETACHGEENGDAKVEMVNIPINIDKNGGKSTPILLT